MIVVLLVTFIFQEVQLVSGNHTNDALKLTLGMRKGKDKYFEKVPSFHVQLGSTRTKRRGGKKMSSCLMISNRSRAKLRHAVRIRLESLEALKEDDEDASPTRKAERSKQPFLSRCSISWTHSGHGCDTSTTPPTLLPRAGVDDSSGRRGGVAGWWSRDRSSSQTKPRRGSERTRSGGGRKWARRRREAWVWTRSGERTRCIRRRKTPKAPYGRRRKLLY